MERSDTESITINDMKGAIRRSWYVLEQRIEPILTEQGYYVQTNPIFLDQETGKSREFDLCALSATRVYEKQRETYDFIFPMVLCECENNAQPLIFFTKESPISFMFHENTRVSGLPVKFLQKDGSWIGFSKFTGMGKFHHYCKGPAATQWCTFHLPKKQGARWIASHDEEQHDSLSSLIKATDYEISRHFDSWYLSEDLKEEAVNVQLYYPILIIQGRLYTATLGDGGLVLRKAKHVQFLKQILVATKKEVETYQIDIITEDFLPGYRKMVDSEIEKIKKVFRRKRDQVLLSLEKIVSAAKRLRRKPKSYRKFFEL